MIVNRRFSRVIRLSVGRIGRCHIQLEKRDCKKIKSILVFASNAVYFKKQGYIAIFLAFPSGEGVNGVDERGHSEIKIYLNL